jgi:8-oxo-dGTP pyrophosphatase MutT (NUDIX family)
MPKSRQIAALPIRRAVDGPVEVLLVTSRETGRWVIPKGWPWPELADHEAAAVEAWEEAGVRGPVEDRSLGYYSYDKRLSDRVLVVRVVVFRMEVAEEAPVWPEAGERRRAWFTPAAAAEAVAEPELKALLLALAADRSA